MKYCQRCKKPLEAEIEWFDGTMHIVNCICDCEEDNTMKRLRAEKNTDESGLRDIRLSGYTFQNDDLRNRPVTDICRKYSEKFEDFKAIGKGLLFYGPPGTGKTFFAGCIANAVLQRGFRVYMTSFPHLMRGTWTEREEKIARLNVYDLLVIDDLGIERNTGYMAEQMQEVIDERYRKKKPVIVTTNVINAEEDITKQRAYSRLVEMCEFVKVDGADRRKEIHNKEHEIVRGLFGG